MRRWVWIACLPLLGMLTLASAGQEKPRLPRDTLPAKLPLTDVPLGLDSRRPIPDGNPLTEADERAKLRLCVDAARAIWG